MFDDEPHPTLPEKASDRVSDVNDITKICLCLHARMTARTVTRAFDKALRDTGLKVTQYTLLCAIARETAGSETALAESLALERTTLVRNLKLLSMRGLIEPLPGSKRGLSHRLTAAGRAALDAAIPVWAEAQAAISQKLAPVAVEDAVSTLRSLRGASR